MQKLQRDEDLMVQEAKPSIVNQCVVYKFKCNLCDAGYVGFSRGHLHERVDGHKRKSSSFNKFDCLIHEALFIRKLKPELNVQTDSICAKVFV